MLKKLVKIIILLFATLIVSIVYATESQAIVYLGSGWDKDGDGTVTDKDIALWTLDPGWFNDTGGWDPNTLIGKSVHFYSASGSAATIRQRGAMCVGHINSGNSVRSYYTITNIVDVDTDTVFNKNKADGDANWAGWPGGVISFGYDRNRVKWPTSNSGAATAVKLAYLTANSFQNAETSSTSTNFKAGLQYTMIQSASTMVSNLGLNSRFSAVKPGSMNIDKMKDAQSYVDTVKAYKFEDATTGTPKVNISGDKSYIGPYKVTTNGGTMASARVVATTGSTTYSVEGISSSVGGTTQSINNISSGVQFYVVVNSQISTNVKVELTKNFEGYKSRMYFMYGGDTNQNIIAYRAEKKTFSNTITLKTANSPEDNAKLKITKIDADTSDKLASVGFKLKYVDTGKWVKRSGNTISYVNSENDATVFTTNSKGEITIEKLKAGDYQIVEETNPNDGYIVSTTPTKATLTDGKTEPVTIKNEYQKGNLELEKVNAYNTSIKLEGVEFTLRCISGEQKGKYVGLNSQNQVYYSNSRVTLKTDSKGKISVKGIWIGTYKLEEVSNPHYGYEIETIGNIVVDSHKTTSKQIKNVPTYIKLSGYVWLDKQYDYGKTTMRNDLYQDTADDTEDERISGIKVSLMEGNTEVKTTTTNENGEYEFEDVEIAKLDNYDIRFEYDGLLYENVEPHFDRDNGSKAAEGSRQQFNNRFASIERGNSESQAAALNSNGKEEARVNYTFEQQNGGRYANIESTENCTITSSIKDAGYEIPYDEASGETEIRNINLGIYERAQTDLATQNELDQVKVEIAGYGHIYKYGPTYDANNAGEVANSWNLGMRFENQYKGTYKRPVYRADAEYVSENQSEMLQMALTYKITIANQSTLATKVNKIVDYFDERYTLVGIGTGINETNGSLTGELSASQYREVTSEAARYKKIEIDLDTLIQSSAADTTLDKKTQTSIYIQFDLSRENIIEMLNEGMEDASEAEIAAEIDRIENSGGIAENVLKNTAEITSFTTYADEAGSQIYAAVDSDSIPGNCTVGNEDTYEDDTDKASRLAIVLANARQVRGKVFEDLKNEEQNRTMNIAEGDSVYDQATENLIGGVTVQLIDEAGNPVQVYDEINEQWVDSNVQTEVGTDGTYTISGFIPGRYKIKFIWGDGTYKIVDGRQEEYQDMIENYKSTVINQDIYENELESNDKFYKEIEEKNRQNNSFAIDDTAKREIIDEPYRTYNFESHTDETTMESYTPTFEINIEYEDEDLMTIDFERVTGKIAFNVNNINLGIIRRPEQSIDLVKTISNIRFTLPNGQVLIDAGMNENGEFEGHSNYTSYIPPVSGGADNRGLIRIEMDSSLLQGSIVEITYRLNTKNTSEADYLDSSYGYYKFGESYYQGRETAKDTDVLTISPTTVVDYMDDTITVDLGEELNRQYEWRQATIGELGNESNKIVNPTVITALNGGAYTMPDGTEGEEIPTKQIFISQYCQTHDVRIKPEYVVGSDIRPVEDVDMYIVGSKVLDENDDASYINQAEVVKVEKGGGKPNWVPGNYIPNETNQEVDDASSEELTIVPSTGENRDYVLPVVIIVVSFLLLGVGIYLIITKIVKRDFK